MEQLPAITSEQAKGTINIALTRHQFAIQTLQTEADALTYSEDEEGLAAAKAYLEKIKRIEGVIEAAHKEGKAPYKAGADAWDEAKRGTLVSISSVTSEVQKLYNRLATKLANAAKEKAAKEAREAQTRLGIEANIIEFSKRIAAAQTIAELVTIQLQISNHKSPSQKAKYGDLHEEAIAVYNEKLLPLLEDKKEGLKALGEMETEFGDTGDYERMEELQSDIDQTRNRLTDTEVRVQEAALGATFNTKPTHEVVIPEVKAKRTTIEFELLDADRAVSKARHLVEVTLNKEACKRHGKAIFDDPTMQDCDDVTSNGIRFYKKRVY